MNFYITHEYDTVQEITIHSFLDELQNEQFVAHLADITHKNNANFIIDMARVPFIGSVGINLLLSVRKLAEKHDGQVVLCYQSPFIQRVLEVSRLTDLFVCVPDAMPLSSSQPVFIR